jgi:hypothetical protein
MDRLSGKNVILLYDHENPEAWLQRLIHIHIGEANERKHSKRHSYLSPGQYV